MRNDNDMVAEKLRRLKEYGESVLEELELVSQTQSLADWIRISAELPNCFQRIREAANKTVERASSAVKIGVMGEFNSGKTLLLGSLIGYADALPISENPTTGNVTAIRLVQQQGLHKTKVNNFTVEYLSHAGVKECLEFMLQEVQRRAKKAGLSEVQLKTLTSLKATNPEVWNDILHWSKQAWSSKNLELRYLLRELVVFARTYNACGAAICGHSYQIDSTTAKEGLTLPDLQMEFQNLSFDDLPPAPKLWQNSPERLSAKDLQNSFSLIRRVYVAVEVSKEIWDLSPLQGTNEFVLLDFPGLGAANSGVRDTFLSLRELAEVQTILILLNGRVPGSDRANQIFTIMQEQKRQEDLKDRILVGVGRFDQLPLDSDGGERVLDELIGNDIFEQEPLSEATVLEKLKILKNTIAGAQAFTNQQDRIVLLSPLLKLADLTEVSSTVQAGSSEWLANLEYNNSLKQFKPLRQKWKQLSERLLDSNPRSNLGRQLDDFAEDGGISRLRQLIQNHVATHGLEQLYIDTRDAAQALRREQDRLHNILEEIQQSDIPTADPPALSTLRQSIQILETTYRSFREDLGKKPLQNRRGEATNDVVKEELTFRIYNWREWTLLFNKVKDGTIMLEESTDEDDDVVDEILGRRRSKRVSNSIPTRSDNFYPPFEKTFQELKVFTRECIQQAVTDLLNNLSAQVAEARNHLSHILRPEMEQLIQQNFGSEEVELFITLVKADEPKQWREGIIKRSSTADSGLQTINPETLFPLARADNKHKNIDQIFDWAPKWSQRNPKPANHQLLVLRLRDEIIASMSLHLIQLISEVTKQVNTTLAKVLDDIVPSLQDLSKKEALLRYIAAGEEQLDGVTPQWLQILAQLASINYPD